MKTGKVLELLEKFATGNISREEDTLLKNLMAEMDRETMETIMQQYEEVVLQTNPDNPDQLLLQRIKDNIAEISKAEENEIPVGNAVVHRMFDWRRMAVAASIILAIGVGSYFMFFNKVGKQDDVAKTQEVKAPGNNKAVITLGNGQKVYLDSAGNGSLAMQGEVNVMKLADGKIVYNGSAKEVVYNTLTNPKGSKVIDITLADGSSVWLNAGSSITYPVAFVGSERKVSITGEAYFEVTHNSAMPFKVSKSDMEVTVLGTRFNVKAYDDEGSINVTLLQGSVKVASLHSSKEGELTTVVIKPGQQAILRSFGSAQEALVQDDKEIKVISDVDLDEVMAWKNGFFNFSRLDIKSIMRQVSRWYDVDVLYEGKPTEKTFSGIVDRNNNISEVLKIMELAGIKFSIEERKIIVKQ